MLPGSLLERSQIFTKEQGSYFAHSTTPLRLSSRLWSASRIPASICLTSASETLVRAMEGVPHLITTLSSAAAPLASSAPTVRRG